MVSVMEDPALVNFWLIMMKSLNSWRKVSTLIQYTSTSAFDKVDHQIVIAKLSSLGIGGKLLDWIKSFLLDCMQHVVVNGFLSSPSHVKFGVPQGSVIGPLLFLILIGHIDADFHNSSLRLFADDTRVLKGINSLRDASLLQHDLTIVYQWAVDNNMLFNSKNWSCYC